MIRFTNMEVAGLIPDFFSNDDPRPAKEQAEENYAHGGGWHPLPNAKWELNVSDWGKYELVYPGDPEEGPDEVYRQLSVARLRDELIVLFEGAWVAIIQMKDDSFEVSRMD